VSWAHDNNATDDISKKIIDGVHRDAEPVHNSHNIIHGFGITDTNADGKIQKSAGHLLPVAAAGDVMSDDDDDDDDDNNNNIAEWWRYRCGEQYGGTEKNFVY